MLLKEGLNPVYAIGIFLDKSIGKSQMLTNHFLRFKLKQF
jgi:hypothetical protein